MSLHRALAGLLASVLLCGCSLSSGSEGSALSSLEPNKMGPPAITGPTLQQYIAYQQGAQAVAQGKMTLDGRPVSCGARPTVIDAKLDSWGGSLSRLSDCQPRPAERSRDAGQVLRLLPRMRPSIRRRERDRRRLLLHPPRRYAWLAQRQGHEPDLRFHLAAERRCRASARPTTLRIDASMLRHGASRQGPGTQLEPCHRRCARGAFAFTLF